VECHTRCLGALGHFAHPGVATTRVDVDRLHPAWMLAQPRGDGMKTDQVASRFQGGESLATGWRLRYNTELFAASGASRRRRCSELL